MRRTFARRRTLRVAVKVFAPLDSVVVELQCVGVGHGVVVHVVHVLAVLPLQRVQLALISARQHLVKVIGSL